MKIWIAMLALIATASPVLADDTLGLMMRDEAGTVSAHAQASSSEQCAAFLDLFRGRRDAGTPLIVTLRDPDFTGTVLASVCIHENGTMTGPDGPMLDLGL